MSAEARPKQAPSLHQGLPRGTFHSSPRRCTQRAANPHRLAWSTRNIRWRSAASRVVDPLAPPALRFNAARGTRRSGLGESVTTCSITCSSSRTWPGQWYSEHGARGMRCCAPVLGGGVCARAVSDPSTSGETPVSRRKQEVYALLRLGLRETSAEECPTATRQAPRYWPERSADRCLAASPWPAAWCVSCRVARRHPRNRPSPTGPPQACAGCGPVPRL